MVQRRLNVDGAWRRRTRAAQPSRCGVNLDTRRVGAGPREAQAFDHAWPLSDVGGHAIVEISEQAGRCASTVGDDAHLLGCRPPLPDPIMDMDADDRERCSCDGCRWPRAAAVAATITAAHCYLNDYRHTEGRAVVPDRHLFRVLDVLDDLKLRPDEKVAHPSLPGSHGQRDHSAGFELEVNAVAVNKRLALCRHRVGSRALEFRFEGDAPQTHRRLERGGQGSDWQGQFVVDRHRKEVTQR